MGIISTNGRKPTYIPSVGVNKIHEDEKSVTWDMIVAPGERLPPHEHMYDYSFYVVNGSRLAVFSGADAKHMFSFDSPQGASMAFKRIGDKMVEVTGTLPPFDAVHGVQNVGRGTYREILTETKPYPCAEKDETGAQRLEEYGIQRVVLSKSSINAKDFDFAGKIENNVDELELYGDFTHIGHKSFQNLAERDAEEISPEHEIVFDFHPNVAKVPPKSEKGVTVKHAVFIQFKVDAPVGELIDGYIGLVSKIKGMKGFEWGPTANSLKNKDLDSSYEYLFITTFANAKGRDAYIVDDAHQEYVKKLVPNIETILVADVIVN